MKFFHWFQKLQEINQIDHAGSEEINVNAKVKTLKALKLRLRVWSQEI